MTSQEFLRDYWQKKPLLIRGALPGFTGLLTREELLKLACHEEVESRLVVQRNGQWQLRHGPFDERVFAKLRERHWTILVQDVNHFYANARDLLLKFRFIPHARLDDVMVSYAPKGGGIGPHFDSYDVFLLQGMGSRRWQISAQQDNEFIADAPLRILKNFCPEQEWVLQSGDMLYLPPQYAHNGIAEEDCMTYSIGFRAPSHQELITQFLVYLQDRFNIDDRYSDPELRLQSHPARISTAMLRQVESILKQIKWDRDDTENFLGTYLTEPKPHVFFEQPNEPLALPQFLQRMAEHGVRLDLKTRMLCSGNKLFINGEVVEVNGSTQKHLEKLADDYALIFVGGAIDSAAVDILYRWYLYGYVELGGES